MSEELAKVLAKADAVIAFQNQILALNTASGSGNIDDCTASGSGSFTVIKPNE